MSQENVEIVRPIYESLNRNDWDGAFRDAHPDFELTTQRGPLAGTYRGRVEAESFLQDQGDAFETRVFEPEEFFASGDQVVSLVKVRSRPKGTSAEIVIRNGHLWTIRDAKVLSMKTFAVPEEALEAAGLSE